MSSSVSARDLSATSEVLLRKFRVLEIVCIRGKLEWRDVIVEDREGAFNKQTLQDFIGSVENKGDVTCIYASGVKRKGVAGLM